MKKRIFIQHKGLKIGTTLMMLNFQEMPFEIFNIVDMSIQMQMIPFFEQKQYQEF